MEINGYEGYIIYKNGQVFSIKSNRFLKPQVYKKSLYKYVGLMKDGKQDNKLIHRLIALHYIPNPNNYLLVDHIDRNPQNNDITNLRWCDYIINNNNMGVFKTNKLGIKNIHMEKNSYRFSKIYKGVIYRKTFTTLEEAIKYKENFLKKIYD